METKSFTFLISETGEHFTQICLIQNHLQGGSMNTCLLHHFWEYEFMSSGDRSTFASAAGQSVKKIKSETSESCFQGHCSSLLLHCSFLPYGIMLYDQLPSELLKIQLECVTLLLTPSSNLTPGTLKNLCPFSCVKW